MSVLETGPLPQELRDLIDAERTRPGMPEDVKARLAAKLGLPPLGGGGGDGEASPVNHGGGPLRGGRPSSLARPHSTTPSVRPPSGLMAHPGLLGAATFVLGLAGGAVLHGAWDANHSSPPAALVAAPAEPVPAIEVPPVAEIALAAPAPAPGMAPQAPAPAPAVSPPLAVVEIVPRSSHSHHSHSEPRLEAKPVAAPAPVAEAVERDRDLGAERTQLEIARTALGRGQSSAAIEALERNAKQFPRGRLAEERESLFVQALVQAGRGREARERGERFRQRFPHSFLLPAVDAALKSVN